MNQLPCGIRGDKRGAGPLTGGEGGRLAGFGVHFDRGGAPAPADRTRGPAKVPPAGLGLCATRHPRHWDGLPCGGEYAARHLTPGPLSGGHVTDPQEGNHQSAGQTGRDRPP